MSRQNKILNIGVSLKKDHIADLYFILPDMVRVDAVGDALGNGIKTSEVYKVNFL